jgi:hypothetical protein
MSEKAHERPITITAVSICFLVFGLIWLIAMASAFFVGAIVSGVAIIGDIVSDVFGVVALLSMLVGVVDLIVGYGLLKMKRWAAILGMLLSLVGAVIENVLGTLFIAPMYMGGFGHMTYVSFAFSSLSQASMWVNFMLFIAVVVSWKSFQSEMA